MSGRQRRLVGGVPADHARRGGRRRAVEQLPRQRPLPGPGDAEPTRRGRRRGARPRRGVHRAVPRVAGVPGVVAHVLWLLRSAGTPLVLVVSSSRASSDAEADAAYATMRALGVPIVAADLAAGCEVATAA